MKTEKISPFFKIHTAIKKINSTFLPTKIHKNLRWYLASFLLLYPLNKTKIKVYKKLKPDDKLSFLIRYLVGQAHIQKIDKQILTLQKEIAQNVHWGMKSVKHLTKKLKAEEDNYKKIIILNELSAKETEQKAYSDNLTKITIIIIEQLYKKRAFMFRNLDNTIDNGLKQI